MHGPARQRGLTLIGWLLTLAAIGLVAIMGLRLVPVYLDAYKVATIMEQLESESRTSSMDRREVRETVRRRLDINDITRVSASDLQFKEIPGGMQVLLEYEARVHLIGNLDAVARFREEATLRR